MVNIDLLKIKGFNLLNEDETRSWTGSQSTYKSTQSFVKDAANNKTTIKLDKSRNDRESFNLTIIQIQLFNFSINNDIDFSLKKSTFSLFKRKKEILDFFKIDGGFKIAENPFFFETLHFFKDLEIEIFTKQNHLYLVGSTNQIDVTETVLKCLDLIEIIKLSIVPLDL